MRSSPGVIQLWRLAILLLVTACAGTGPKRPVPDVQALHDNQDELPAMINEAMRLESISVSRSSKRVRATITLVKLSASDRMIARGFEYMSRFPRTDPAAGYYN